MIACSPGNSASEVHWASAPITISLHSVFVPSMNVTEPVGGMSVVSPGSASVAVNVTGNPDADAPVALELVSVIPTGDGLTVCDSVPLQEAKIASPLYVAVIVWQPPESGCELDVVYVATPPFRSAVARGEVEPLRVSKNVTVPVAVPAPPVETIAVNATDARAQTGLEPRPPQPSSARRPRPKPVGQRDTTQQHKPRRQSRHVREMWLIVRPSGLGVMRRRRR